MKHKIIICLLIWVLPYTYVIAQNPYTQFGSKVTELTANIDTSYQIVFNHDPTSDICKMGFDFKNKKIDFYGVNNTIVKVLFIAPDIFLHWISPDPKEKDYPGWSPYNFVENNPIKNTDPTGMGVNTDIEGENGDLIKHIDDGSNAVFQQTGSGVNLHYQFSGFKDQGGINKVNLQTAIQAAQDLNNNNPSLLRNGHSTYCNFATENILSTVNSATTYKGQENNQLPTSGQANVLYNNFSTNPALIQINTGDAIMNAAIGGMLAQSGNLVLMSYYEKPNGHVATFAVDQNQPFMTVANVGANNGFLPLSPQFNTTGQASYVPFLDASLPFVQYYTLSNSVAPKVGPPTICNLSDY